MRITKITAKKLFGIFDHEIPLNLDSRITIMHGPNGVGKTVLLRMIDGLFSRSYQVFGEVPFQNFCIEFDCGDRLAVIHEDNSRQLPLDLSYNLEPHVFQRIGTIYVRYINSNGDIVHEYEVMSSRPRRHHHQFITDSTEEWYSDSDIDLHELAGLSLEEARDLIDDQINEWMPSKDDEKKWLQEIQRSRQTLLISSDRLQPKVRSKAGSISFARPAPSTELEETVKKHARDLAHKIRSALDEYGEIAQRKDRTFPRRLIQSAGKLTISESQLKTRLRQLEQKSTELMRLGLLDRDEDALDVRRFGVADKNIKETLSIYVADIEEKLSVFDTIAQQLRILTDIVNKRFQHKRLTIDKQHGFVISPLNGDQPIPLQSLSSGEQHELVLLYQLLFDAKPNALIMIDEPEISLHVNWQEQFLNDIQRVSDLRQFDVLIATHSPDIISDKHEWMVELDEAVPA